MVDQHSAEEGRADVVDRGGGRRGTVRAVGIPTDCRSSVCATNGTARCRSTARRTEGPRLASRSADADSPPGPAPDRDRPTGQHALAGRPGPPARGAGHHHPGRGRPVGSSTTCASGTPTRTGPGPTDTPLGAPPHWSPAPRPPVPPDVKPPCERVGSLGRVPDDSGREDEPARGPRPSLRPGESAMGGGARCEQRAQPAVTANLDRTGNYVT